jgi:hypothetical protein
MEKDAREKELARLIVRRYGTEALEFVNACIRARLRSKDYASAIRWGGVAVALSSLMHESGEHERRSLSGGDRAYRRTLGY